MYYLTCNINGLNFKACFPYLLCLYFLGAMVHLHAQVMLPPLQNSWKPDPAPAPPGDKFNPPVSNITNGSVPACAEWTRTAGPDESIIITGINFTSFTNDKIGKDTRFLAFGKNIFKEAKIQQLDVDKAVITLSRTMPSWSMYLIWPKNSEGYGYPIAVNKTDAWWIGPDKNVAGGTSSVYGRNLSKNNDTVISYVYIKSASMPGQWVSVIKANPYKVDFKIPANLVNGDYEVWAHNGHGGDFGWSGPLKLTIDNGLPWDSSVVNVQDFGAKGDGIHDDLTAIQNAINYAKELGRATLYFPTGVYMVSNSLMVADHTKWKGDGKGKSILRCTKIYPENSLGMISGAVTDVEISNVSFDGNGSFNGVGSSAISLRGSKNLHINQVEFIFNHYGILDIHDSRYVYIKNCDFIGKESFLGNCSQLFIDSCNFKMTNDADLMLQTWGGNGISLTNSTCSDYDNSDPNNGSGWGKGRFFVGSGIWGSNRFTYLANNETKDLTVRLNGPDLNSGEQFLWEGNETLWTGRVASSTATSTSLNGYAGSDPTLQMAVIVQGRGVGQVRLISGFTNGVIFLNEPWNVAPDKSSILNIGTYTNNVVVYKNYLDGKSYAATNTDHIASAGIEPFGGVFNFIADNNTMNEVRAGIANWSLSNNIANDPNFFNLFVKNKITNCRWGISNIADIPNSKGTGGTLGIIYRKNVVSSALAAAVNNSVNTAGSVAIGTTVYEGNIFDNIDKGIASDSTGILNQVYYKNTFKKVVSGASSYAIDVTPTSIFRENVYNGFSTPYSKIMPIAMEAPFHVVDIKGTSNGMAKDTSFSIWNSGNVPINWSAESNAKWLSLQAASGQMADEKKNSIIKLKASPEGLDSGYYEAEVKVSAEGISKTYSVNFTVGASVTCTDTGGISWQYWANFEPHLAMSSMPVNSAATADSILTSFSAPANIADKYGARVRGYICPPISGYYQFFISSDDNSELWLSNNENESGKQKIAFIQGFTNPEVYDKYVTQQSDSIYLQNGTRYYVEVRYRDFYKYDHMSVGWRLPDSSIESPIRGRHLIPFENFSANNNKTAQRLMEVENRVDEKENQLLKIVPNPFSNVTYIMYTLPYNTQVSVQVFNAEGQLVQVIYNGKVDAFKTYKSQFKGEGFASGTYICRLTYGGKVMEKRFVYIK